MASQTMLCGRMGGKTVAARQTTIDLRSPAHIAEAIVKVNKTFGLHRTGMNVLWKLYYAPNHALTRAELQKEFGLLEDHFGLFCRRVTQVLGADDSDALALVNSSQDESG